MAWQMLQYQTQYKLAQIGEEFEKQLLIIEQERCEEKQQIEFDTDEQIIDKLAKINEEFAKKTLIN